MIKGISMRPIILFCMVSLAAPIFAQQSRQTVPFLADLKLMDTNKRKISQGDEKMKHALTELLREADAALTHGPYSVINKKKTPPSGDKHDYMSVGPYWWPDSTKPDGLPYVRRDGVVNPERHAVKDSDDLKSLSRDVKFLGLAYYFTGDPKYPRHAKILLKAWFIDKETKMNPHLRYGQAIPGITEGRGIGLIDTKCLVDVIDAVQLIESSDIWTKTDHEQMQSWFAEFLDWMLTSPIGKDEADEHNNHGVYYDVQTVTFSLFTGNEKQAKKILQEQTIPRIESQIRDDGSQPYELARTKSWSYSIMNLKGFFALARLGEHVGVDLWNHKTTGGKGIKKAFEWLLPFASGEKQWTHQQIDPIEWQTFVPLLRMAEPHYDNKLVNELINRYSEEYRKDYLSVLTNTMFY
jgi:hypothetical protein